MTGAAPAIEVIGLTKRYGSRAVVDGVSLTVASGELVALLGPNGAGKTTTVEVLEGYRSGDAGSVRVLGADPRTGGPGLRARVGLMLQDGGFDPRARPRETLVQFGRFHAAPLDPDALLATVGLSASATTPYKRLSGGEKQRLGLAVALVGRPDVAILDEPTAGMDPEARAVTRGIVRGLVDGGAAVLLTSHDLTDVERLADRVYVLDAGRVVATGSPDALMAASAPGLRFRLDVPLGPAQRDRLGSALALARPGARLVGEDASRFSVDGVLPDPELIAALATWCASEHRLIVETHVAGGTLEEAYFELIDAGRGLTARTGDPE